MVFVCLQVGSEARFFTVSLVEGLHGVEYAGVRGGWTGEGDRAGFKGSRESRLRERAAL